jgi:hypothetical protein
MCRRPIIGIVFATALMHSEASRAAEAETPLPSTAGEFAAYCDNDLQNCSTKIAEASLGYILQQGAKPLEFCINHAETKQVQGLSDASIKKVEDWLNSHPTLSTEEGIVGALKEIWPPPC